MFLPDLFACSLTHVNVNKENYENSFLHVSCSRHNHVKMQCAVHVMEEPPLPGFQMTIPPGGDTNPRFLHLPFQPVCSALSLHHTLPAMASVLGPKAGSLQGLGRSPRGLLLRGPPALRDVPSSASVLQTPLTAARAFAPIGNHQPIRGP